MIIYLIAQLFLALFNVGNAFIDAHRIMMGKRIYHGVNFGIYVLVTVAIGWVAHWSHWSIATYILLTISAFCNRQLSFDIPLNLMRGLKWDYVSLAKPPKSIMDRIEIRIFGYNGRVPVFLYAALWLICLIVKTFV